MRITTFDQELSQFVITSILNHLPPRIDIYKTKFRLDGWTLDRAQHPWAGQDSFSGLSEKVPLLGNLRQIRLEFTSPTAFRSKGADIPLPVPGSLLRSYWEKWNACAPEPLKIQPIWPDFASACVVINELTGINTDRWAFAEGARGYATGFTGTVGLALLPKRQCGDFIPYWDGADLVLRLLGLFAFYCGTGHHTTVGLGQTHPLPAPTQEFKR